MQVRGNSTFVASTPTSETRETEKGSVVAKYKLTEVKAEDYGDDDLEGLGYFKSG